jgi:hypothetical protein
MRIRPSVLVLFVLCVIACQREPSSSVPVRVWDINAADLHRSYRDYSERWTGQRVRIILVARSYTASGVLIYWHSDRDTDPPSIVFECNGVHIPDNASTLEIVGHVTGKRDDGRMRATGHRWCIVVASCEVSRVAAR